MIDARYQELSTHLLDLARQIEESKRPAYTVGSSDVLHNFKMVAARAGISPMQAWAVYFLKHIDAITALAKDPTIPQAEAIEGRFADAINYLKLGYALLQEEALKREMPATSALDELPPYRPIGEVVELTTEPEAIEYRTYGGREYVHTYGTAFWKRGKMDRDALHRSDVQFWRLRPDIQATLLKGTKPEGVERRAE